jgi:hypothetical protein
MKAVRAIKMNATSIRTLCFIKQLRRDKLDKKIGIDKSTADEIDMYIENFDA